MKVLIVSPKSQFYGGGERVIVKLCDYLSNHAIVHALAMPSMTDEMRKELSGTPIISSLPALIANVNSFDIVNYHNFPSTLLSMFIQKPGIWYCNEPAEMFTNWKRKFIEWGNRNLIKNRIENVVVADKYNARRCLDIYGVTPKIIPYGIDYEFFSKVQHNPDDNYFTVIQVGTISHYKNQLATIEAVGNLKSKIKNIRLWLVGNVSEADYKRQVEDAIQRNNLGGCVTWEPHVSREHLRELYSKTDVLLHPVKEQGGWLSPFEAISAGVPVIVTPDLSCADMIQANKLGQVTTDLSGALFKLFQNYEDYHTCKAKMWVKNNLTWDNFCSSMVKRFEEILNHA